MDSDTATLTLAPFSMAEGSGGPDTVMLFQATLTGNVASSFDVAYTVADGTATMASGDYSAADGTLSFSGAGTEVQVIEVLVGPDAVVEPDETLTAALGAISIFE